MDEIKEILKKSMDELESFVKEHGMMITLVLIALFLFSRRK